MTLHVATAGHGPALVLVHGWGLHSAIWDAVLPRLTARFRVSRVDLPGHGGSPPAEGEPGLAGTAAALLEAVPGPAAWVGWSLGGQLALAAACQRAERVQRLVLVATTPRFLAAPDWPCGLGNDVLEGFARSLAEDYRGTVRRFLALQAMGDAEPGALLRRLRAVVLDGPRPHPGSLAQGLKMLAQSDLRGTLGQIAMPALVISGANDRLTPPAAGRRLAAALPRGRFEQVAGAAHAPFLSRPGEFLDHLCGFLAEHGA